MQQVHDIARLLHVVDVADDVLTVLLVQLLDDVHGVVGVHLLHLLGDLLVGHQFHQVVALVLVQFDKDIGCRLVVEHEHDEQRFLVIEVAYQFGDVGGVQIADLSPYQFIVLAADELFEI